MLSVLDHFPEGLLDLPAGELHRVLRGPTLIHLPGRRAQPLFASVLLHGNEDTGWEALRVFLRSQDGAELPRALSVFIGNVEAARQRRRFLDGQPDYNRIWTEMPAIEHLPERAMTREVVHQMRAREVFASVDIHNNTGLNPHYACVRRLDNRFLQLATLFSRTVVFYRKPDGVQAEAFSGFCPAVTAECGQPGQPYGVEHAADFLRACLSLADIPTHPVAEHDMDLYHTVAIVKVPEDASVGLEDDADIRLAADLDHLNFRELPVNTVLARLRPGSGVRLRVHDEHGRDVAERYLRIVDHEIRTAIPVMPSMLTLNATAIRQDCLCYLMERPGRLAALTDTAKAETE
jgi:succinylglutamate desuccinylase